MKNKILATSLGFYASATVLGIIATTGILDAKTALHNFHVASTAVCLGLMGLATMLVGKLWKE